MTTVPISSVSTFTTVDELPEYTLPYLQSLTTLQLANVRLYMPDLNELDLADQDKEITGDVLFDWLAGSLIGGNYYATTPAEREALFVSGLEAGQQLTLAGYGQYTILQDYSGLFAGAVEGVHYAFVPDGAARIVDPDPFPDPADIHAPEVIIYESPAGGNGVPYYRENNTTYTQLLTGSSDFGFTDLGDTPADYTGQAGYLLRVNPTEDGIETLDPVGIAYTPQAGWGTPVPNPPTRWMTDQPTLQQVADYLLTLVGDLISSGVLQA